MTCPICGKETAPSYRPFCSRRCADVDLARWLTGAYAIPADAPEDADAAEPADTPSHPPPH
ncbi:DNA gyrase inhibitor YacG [Roseicyclus persicicus]|uniref:DNA gyrase inhibitor YacG n=1 Tax=Roseicyclus persicicus TaxID=2650661 RepID=A0A7X6GX53_9RHOB|nr:DNA gyrase inhibitor YacG [Roseibacterium persicicum]NKX43981.1 DNA gyrase inhibitor YacG [Roseibacterium persicicum]